MLKYLIRFGEAVARYSAAVANLGLVSTGRIIAAKLFPTEGVSLLTTSKFGKVYWRTKGDWTVLSHLYMPQIFLNTGKDPVAAIIDAGANIGMESLRFAKLYPQARIVALEADRENAEILRRNASGFSAISVLHKGLWNKDAKLKVTRRTEDNQSFFVEELPLSAAEFDIEAVSMDGLMRTAGFGEIDIFKIDIEGAEAQLFDESCDSWLRSVRSFIIECPDVDAPLTTQKIYDAFRRNGISVNSYIHGENLVLVRGDLDWRPETVLHY